MITFVDFERMGEWLESDDPSKVQSAKFVRDMQYLVDEGVIRTEVDDDGEIRFYPVHEEL